MDSSIPENSRNPSGDVDSGSQRILKNTGILSAASVITKVLSALVAILMARKLGKEIFGAYETAFALTFSLVSFSEFGTCTVVTRMGSTSGEKMSRYLGSALVFKFIVAVVVFPCAILIAWIAGYSKLVLQLALILLLFTVASSFINTLNSVFQAHQRMSGLAISELVGNVIFASIAVAILFSSKSVQFVASSRVLGGFVTLFLLIYIINSWRLVKFKLNLRLLPKLLLMGLPFGLATLVSAWRLRIDIMLLSALSGEAEAGIFASSYRLLNFLLILALSFSYALTPAAFALGNQNNNKFSNTFRRSTFAGLLLAVPAASGVFFLSRPVISALFGAEYAPVLIPLKILCWVLPCLLVWSATMNSLWGAKREYLVPIFLAVGLMVNIIVDYLLIPVWGAFGASIGALAGLSASILGAIIYLRLKLFSLKLFKLSWAPITGSLIMLGVLYGLHPKLISVPGHLFIEIIIGMIIYTACLVGFFRAGILPYSDYCYKAFTQVKNKIFSF